MIDVWRVTAVLEGRRDAKRLAKRVADGGVHAPARDTIAGYRSSEREIHVVRKRILDLLTRENITATVRVWRWNPRDNDWQDPALPVEPPESEPVWVDLDELQWEVRARLRDTAEAYRVRRALIRFRIPALGRGWRGVWAAARTERDARHVASLIRNESRTARTSIRALTRFRRWLLKQGLMGNYANGGDRRRVGFDEDSGWGSGGDGGGGDGGGGNGGA